MSARTVVFALTSILSCAGSVATAQGGFHTSPECWTQPRLYHSGPPAPDLARRIAIVQTAAVDPSANAVLSPNGAYRFWVRQPDTSQSGPWGAGIVVDTERDNYSTMNVTDVAQTIAPRWLNEKLIYVRVAWGRLVFSDLIWDVESGALIYHELAHDGTIAFSQYRQACEGRCPCDSDGAVADAKDDELGEADIAPDRSQRISLPNSAPAPGVAIGLLALPELFGAGEGSRPAASPEPVTVYARPEERAKKIGEIRTRRDADYGEIGYEFGALVVYEDRGAWYRVGQKSRADQGGRKSRWRDGWITTPDPARYHANADLLQNRFGYLNGNWNGELRTALDGKGQVQTSALKRANDGDTSAQAYPANIVESRMTPDGLWVKVELYRNSPCETGDQTIAEQGWVPAYSSAGQLSVWYWSRGC